MLRFIAIAATVAIVCLPTAGFAQIETAVQAFDEGNEQYRTGNYQEALAAYEQAIAGGYASGALLYNMGNAYYRLDELGQAIRYYEKARLLIPQNDELLHNLEIAKAKAVDQFSSLPTPAWMNWWYTMLERSGGRWLFWIGFLLYLAAIAIIIYRFKFAPRDPWVRRARAIVVLLCLVLLAAAFTASMQSVETRQAVVLSERVDLRETPAADGFSETAIHEGVVVDVLQESDTWIEIRLPNGGRGWVPADVVGEI